MRTASVTSLINCDVDTFWKVFFDDAYNKAFYLQEMGFFELEILSKTDTSRVMRAVPKLNMPKPVMKLLGNSFGYEERGTFDREKSEWAWKMVPNKLADKLSSHGTVRVEAAGEGKCRRSDAVTIEAKIFGVGRLVESSTEKEVRTAWSKESSFINRWLKDHPPE